MNREQLTQAVHSWLETAPDAGDAADWLLDKADSRGQIPKRLTFDAAVPWQSTMASFFSARFVRSSRDGQKIVLDFDRWEIEYFGVSGILLPVLASARERTPQNRREQRRQREASLEELLNQYLHHDGLTGHVAQAELKKLANRQGRFWIRSSRYPLPEISRELHRYFTLLHYVDSLRRDPERIERVVHVSRMTSGDTHWLRPHNRVWRDLAEDLLDFDQDLKSRLNGLNHHEMSVQALVDVGIVENLTSVVVLVYGHFGLKRGNSLWNWPEESAQQQLPVWLSAIHLQDCQIISKAPINQIISIENETSFLDLVEQHGDDDELVLVYTEGQANRAVVGLMLLLAAAAPTARFQHQGDLDLAGIRILASLYARTALPIEPSLMDAATHKRFARFGIELTAAEREEVSREMATRRLPCRDLLEQLSATGIRIEQETITADRQSSR